MWNARYWNPRYWAERYWAKVGAAAAQIVADACDTFYVSADSALTVASDDTSFAVGAADQNFAVEGCD